MSIDPDLQRLVEGFHHDPHAVLGIRDAPDGMVVRVRRPEATGVSMEVDGQRCEGRHLVGGVFEIPVPRAPQPSDPVHVRYEAFDVDVVDVFRRSEAAGEFADQAVAIGAKGVWFQLGVVDQDAFRRTTEAGVPMVMDTCPVMEWPRLGRTSA